MPLIATETDRARDGTRGVLGHLLLGQDRKQAMMSLYGQSRARRKRNYRQSNTWQSQIPKESQMGRWHPGERGKRLLADAGTSWEPETAGLGEAKAQAAA